VLGLQQGSLVLNCPRLAPSRGAALAEGELHPDSGSSSRTAQAVVLRHQTCVLGEERGVAALLGFAFHF